MGAYCRTHRDLLSYDRYHMAKDDSDDNKYVYEAEAELNQQSGQPDAGVDQAGSSNSDVPAAEPISRRLRNVESTPPGTSGAGLPPSTPVRVAWPPNDAPVTPNIKISPASPPATPSLAARSATPSPPRTPLFIRRNTQSTPRSSPSTSSGSRLQTPRSGPSTRHDAPATPTSTMTLRSGPMTPRSRNLNTPGSKQNTPSSRQDRSKSPAKTPSPKKR